MSILLADHIYYTRFSEFWVRLSGSLLLKVCDDISYQVKATEVAEICSEEAAVTDTRPAWCLHALTCQYSIPACD